MKVFTTLGRKKQEFIPQESDKVRMYVCGVTLYDECHLGHGRAYIVFDVIRRFLESLGYKVIYVQNFTDIDDKIIKKSQEEAKEEKEIPDKVKEIYYAIRRDHPEYPKELAIRIAWAKYKKKEGPPYSAPLTPYPKKKASDDIGVLKSALARVRVAENAPLKVKKKIVKKILPSLRKAGVPIRQIFEKLRERKARGVHTFIRALRRYLEARIVELRK